MSEETNQKRTSKLERLEEQNARLQKRLSDIEEKIETNDSEGLNIGRRGALSALGGAGLLTLGAGSASAAPGDNVKIGERAGLSASSEVILAKNYGSGPGIVGRATGKTANALMGFAESSSGANNGLVGRTESSDGTGVRGYAAAAAGNNIGTVGITDSTDGVGVEGRATASSGQNFGVKGTVNSSGGYGLYTPDDCKVEGDLQVSGTKNFVQAVETPAGEKEVAYTAVEAGTPMTEASDVAEMTDGRAEVDLPEHFEMVTSEDEPLNVQITPYATEKVQPQVVDRSTDRIVVEDFSDTDYDYTFAYTVKGTREGFEDRDIVREK